MNTVGTRAVIGLVVPSTNTVVEHDMWQVRPDGVTFAAGRMYLTDPSMDGDAAFLALLEQIRASIQTAIRDVLTCRPDHLLMGMSAETFWGGVAGNDAFEQRVKEQSGLGVTTGATATRLALEVLGARRIAVFSPYQPVADREVARFFTEAGFEVAAVTGLRCSSATAIADVEPPRLREVVDEIDRPGVDAIVQVGTNLSFLRQAAQLEDELGKPVVAINAATLWHALRAIGVEDRFEGFGCLLAQQ